MKTNSQSEILDSEIAILTQRKRQQWVEIKDDVNEIKENLKPINLLKNAVGEVKENIGANNDILKSLFSFGVGYLTSKLVPGKSDSNLKKIASSLILMGVTKFIDKSSIMSR